MPKYNLDSLNDEEFERLCQSILQKIIGPGINVYGVGKDGAREATFQGKAPYPSSTEQWSGNWVFQVKFHDVNRIGLKAARNIVLTELKEELLKITKKYRYNCNNFLLLTNVSLSPVFETGTKDKLDKLAASFEHKVPHIKVLGAEEICCFLDSYTDIKQSYSQLLVTGDIIAHLIGMVKREETELDETIQLYCQGCFSNERKALLDDSGDVLDRDVALQEVFIDLSVMPTGLPGDQRSIENLPNWLRQASEDKARSSALSYLLDDTIEGLVLEGGPGEGKSTLCQYIAQVHRARLLKKLNDLGKDSDFLDSCYYRIPFRVFLKDYAQWVSAKTDNDSLFNYLAIQVSRWSGKDCTSQSIHTILKTNPTLLILDGLDEISDKKLRTRVINNITIFLSQVKEVYKSNLRVLSSTRQFGYSQEFDPAHYLHLKLQPLSSGTVTAYAKKWIQAKKLSHCEADRILDTIKKCLDDKVVTCLAKTPLQITILLFIIRAKGTLPNQREELFDTYMKIMYEREQKKGLDLLRTEQQTIYGLHKYLAYILHKRAETDKTAAVMDLEEFRNKVHEYLLYDNALLTTEEIESKANQIITEASQRLVLIEGVQEGKVGFGLTMTREFFAAAHLVDTAKGKLIDLRFKALVRSPHWHNVALFFAGRVGRNRPEDAPSMVDICRQIDMDRVDKSLKRGAQMVMEMVDDHAFRVQYNEIGAIEFALTLIDASAVRNKEEIVKILINFADVYKDRLIRPWLEQKLSNLVPEKSVDYFELYVKIFGFNEAAEKIIRNTANGSSPKLKKWCLKKAIENTVIKPWVASLLDDLAATISIDDFIQELTPYKQFIISYLRLPLSKRTVELIGVLLVYTIDSSKTIESINQELERKGEISVNSENLVYLNALSLFLSLGERYSKKATGYANLSWPFTIDPETYQIINKHRESLSSFCKNFQNGELDFTKCFVSITNFLLDFENVEKFRQAVVSVKGLGMPDFLNLWFLREALPDDDELIPLYHMSICLLNYRYKTSRFFEEDISSLNKLLYLKDTEQVFKFTYWVDNGCPSSFETCFDNLFLKKVKDFTSKMGVPVQFLAAYQFNSSHSFECSYNVCMFCLRIIEERLNDRRVLLGNPLYAFYDWSTSKPAHKIAIKEKLRQLFSKLSSYDSTPPTSYRLTALYWFAANGGAIDNTIDLKTLFNLLSVDAALSERTGYVHETSACLKSFWLTQLNSDKVEEAKLGAISFLMYLNQSTTQRARVERGNQDTWIGERLWELSRLGDLRWQRDCIAGLSHCKIRWLRKKAELLEEIGSNDGLVKSWVEVITNSGFANNKDRKALFSVLLSILEKPNIDELIRKAALQRVAELVMEANDFNEQELNLPLPKRLSHSTNISLH